MTVPMLVDTLYTYRCTRLETFAMVFDMKDGIRCINKPSFPSFYTLPKTYPTKTLLSSSCLYISQYIQASLAREMKN